MEVRGLKKERLYRILKGKIDPLERREKDADQKKTYDEVFDYNTLLSLYKYISKGTIDSLEHAISTGKEGNVFRAVNNDGDMFAVKIYRISTATFKNLTKYITGDTRFRNVPKDHRRLVYLWAQKEYKNLQGLFDAGVAVPKPIGCSNNVLIMEYLGDAECSAPMLKDVELENPEETLEYIINMMKRSYIDANLIHGDLSEYNILVRDEDPYFIDVGQAVIKEHPMSEELLQRDVSNIVKYFNRLGLNNEEDEIFKRIRGE
jgi:RIO kinase 1